MFLESMEGTFGIFETVNDDNFYQAIYLIYICTSLGVIFAI